MSSPATWLANGILPYGTEFWFTNQTSRAEMLADFSRMREMGMSTIRIFVPLCEADPDCYDYVPVDAVFDCAAECGLTVCPTFSLDLPERRKQLLGLDPSLGVPLPYLLDDPAYRAQLAPLLQNLVRRFAGHPALWSWILWNEPSRSPFFPPPPPVWQAFRVWLSERYTADFNRLHAAWYPDKNTYQFADFAALEPRHLHGEWTGLWASDPAGLGYRALVSPLVLRLAAQIQPKGWEAFPIWRDWLAFNTDSLTASIRWLASLVREADPRHPTQINPDGFLQNQAAVSRDLNALAREVDLFGSSLHPGHHFSYIQAEDQMPAAFAYYTQAIASAAGGTPALVTELQAGPNTWSGNKQFTPDSNDLVLGSLTALGSGLKGIIYWLWKPRPGGWEAGEWGLLQHNGSSPRALGAARLGQFVREHSAWLAALKPARASVAILRSPESETLGLIESLYARQPVDKYQTLSEYGCFRALWRAGIAARFVTPTEIQNGALTGCRCLFIPFGEAFSPTAAAAVEKFTRAGGWVYAETPLATKDGAGNACPTWPGFSLDQTFAQALDIWPARKAPLLDTPFGALHSELFIQPLESRDHEVVAELPDGYDVIIEREVGKGRALYAGTCLTLFCGRSLSAPAEEAFLVDFALRAGAHTWWQGEPPLSAAVYHLKGPESDGLVVINHSADEADLELSLPLSYRGAAALLGRGAPLLSRRTLRVRLAARSAEVVRLTR